MKDMKQEHPQSSPKFMSFMFLLSKIGKPDTR